MTSRSLAGSTANSKQLHTVPRQSNKSSSVTRWCERPSIYVTDQQRSVHSSSDAGKSLCKLTKCSVVESLTVPFNPTLLVLRFTRLNHVQCYLAIHPQARLCNECWCSQVKQNAQLSGQCSMDAACSKHAQPNMQQPLLLPLSCAVPQWLPCSTVGLYTTCPF
jgi:hypothetical protein